MIYLCLVVLPLMSGLWFFNFALLLKKLYQGRDIHNETVLGTVLMVVFVFLCMIGLVGLH
ncbi:hypothetical protein [Anoxybacillus flavithermus]|uniref:Uncharacterized protein n=1 Tax=Anoxybacillus flavithermus TaxID=33934 RepID=A0AAX1ZXS5_9BACL|nr:hypothetical protein [Anoxybacillus flavithermus]ASA96135.1 hypothetical protein CA592_04455 [Anoxybacillus flavithermus]MBE2906450.1 hypothetical protein [Anoxybacillus flavithermus]MBE2919978.1 hypothetical protein [Anoxybacillus flavithermus]MBE2922720.1 hypothetical protein [Anoxybacillus flavithermus]MBE2925489.1 hypothetical protein [Anoxybacillus flavithermus]